MLTSSLVQSWLRPPIWNLMILTFTVCIPVHILFSWLCPNRPWSSAKITLGLPQSTSPNFSDFSHKFFWTMLSTTTELPLLWHDVCAFFSVSAHPCDPIPNEVRKWRKSVFRSSFQRSQSTVVGDIDSEPMVQQNITACDDLCLPEFPPQPSKIAFQVQNQVFNPRACGEHFVFSPNAYVVSCPREIWLPHWVMFLRRRRTWKSEQLLRTPSMFPKQLTDRNKIEYFLPLGHFCSGSVHLVYDTSRC